MKKHNTPLDLDEEDEDENSGPINHVQIGDLVIASKKPIKNYTAVVSNLLANKNVKNYLGIYNKRNFKAPCYVD
jgi:hypothetical protein